jgi:hypothetical protein
MLFFIAVFIITLEAVFATNSPTFCIQDEKASIQYGKGFDSRKEGFDRKFVVYQTLGDVFNSQDCCTLCSINQFYWCVIYEYNTMTNQCTLWKSTSLDPSLIEKWAATFYTNARNKISGNWISQETLDVLRLDALKTNIKA